MISIVRVLLFFVPIAWITLSGPLLGGVLLLAAGGAVAEVIRLRRVQDLVAAWPLAILVALWCVWGVFAEVPPADDLLPPRDFALCFVFATAAGVCIREYSRRSQTGTLVAIQAGVLLLVTIGVVIGFSPQAADAVSVSAGQIERDNPLHGMTLFGIFKADNIIVGIISYTLYAALLLPLVLLELPAPVSLVCVAASALAVALNLKLLTRTVFLALPIAAALVLFIMLQDRRSISTSLLLRKIFVGVALAIAGAVALTAATGDLSLFLDRVTESTDDPRWDIWRESMRIIPGFPWGGGYRTLTLHDWAHNLFLDAALFNGLPGMAIMVAIYLLVWRRAATHCFAPGIARRPVDVYFITCIGALAAVHMVMPPMLQLTCFGFLAHAALGRPEDEEESARETAFDPSLSLN